MEITLKINGSEKKLSEEPRTLLVHAIRDAGLTGTHIGCDSSSCGVCTVVLDGKTAVKSCTMFAVQAEGHEITTIEGMAQGGKLHPLQQAFHDQHGLQLVHGGNGHAQPAHTLCGGKFGMHLFYQKEKIF